MTLKRKAQEHIQPALDWCAANGIETEVVTSGFMNHPHIVLSVNGLKRKCWFPGSPSDERGRLNFLSDVRGTARKIGWTEEKPEMVHMASGGLSKFDAQRPSEGPASPVTITRPAAADALAGRYGLPPELPQDLRGVSLRGGNNILRDRLPPLTEARAKWIMVIENQHLEWAHEKLTDAGWSVSLNSLSALKTKARAKFGLAKLRPHKPQPKKSWVESAPEPVPVKRAVPVLASASLHSDVPSDFALALARQIEALMGDHLAGLKAKADKWDAIAGLVKDA